MRNQTKVLAVLSTAAFMAALAPQSVIPGGRLTAFAAEKGWVEEDGSFVFYDEDGYKESSTWKKKDGDWFYLDENGTIAVNQRVDEYYVNAEGRMVKNQWVSADGEEDYDTPDSPDMSNWHYFGKDGKITASKWMTIADKTYYFDEDGQMMTGMAEIDDATYYLGDENDGSRKTGWILLETMTHDSDDEDIWCYFDENGKMVTYQLDRKIDGNYYTFIDGKMQTGWVNLVDAGFIASESETPVLSHFRYYDENDGGKRASGWYTMEGAEGISESDEEQTFYFKDGIATHASYPGLELFTINSQRYCFNEKGEMQTGLQTIPNEDGQTASYYFNDNGVMQTGKQTIYDSDSEENRIWYFHTKGSSKGQGYHGERDNQVYIGGLLQKADAELRYMPVSVGEKQYLVNTSGNVQKASASNSSSEKPELGKGYKDFKDTNDKVWTVDSSGIIQ